jgi:putative ABC transport system permease protein
LLSASTRRTDRFTIIAVLTLAIGIGSNIAVFRVVNALLFRSLPYPDGDHLVQVGRTLNEGPVYPMSYALPVPGTEQRGI